MKKEKDRERENMKKGERMRETKYTIEREKKRKRNYEIKTEKERECVNMTLREREIKYEIILLLEISNWRIMTSKAYSKNQTSISVGNKPMALVEWLAKLNL